MSVTPYCTEADLRSIAGNFTIDQQSDDEGDSTTDSALVDDAMEQGALEMHQFLSGRYSAAIIRAYAPAWAKWCNAYLALCYLSGRRANPVPDTYSRHCERYRELLDRIQAGQVKLPTDTGTQAPQSLDGMPTVSNLTVDKRFKAAQVRRVQETSTGNPPGDGRKQFNQPNIHP